MAIQFEKEGEFIHLRDTALNFRILTITRKKEGDFWIIKTIFNHWYLNDIITLKRLYNKMLELNYRDSEHYTREVIK